MFLHCLTKNDYTLQYISFDNGTHSLGHFAGLTSAMSQDLFPSSVALILQQALQLMVGESGHSAKATQAHPLTSQRG